MSKQRANKEQINMVAVSDVMEANIVEPRHVFKPEPPHVLASRTVAEQGLNYLCQLTADLQAAQDRITLLESREHTARIERDDAVREAAKLGAILEALCVVLDKYRSK